MPETGAAIVAWFAEAGAGAAAAEGGAVAAEGAGAAAAGGAGAAAGGAAASASAGSGFLAAAGQAAAGAAAGAAVSSLLAPTPNFPGIKAPLAMPDPLAQQEARRRSIIDQVSRRGRASTIMTNPNNSGKLGG